MKTGTGKMQQHDGVRAGFTVVELLCACAMILIAIGAALVTFIGVQRSLTASLYQMNAQADQNRVFSYLRTDLRGASSIQINDQGTEVTMTIPAQTTLTFNLNLGLSLLSLLTPPQNASNNTTIQYYRQGSSIIREVNGVSTVLSNSATTFQLSLSGSLVQFTTAFQPQYSLQNGTQNSQPDSFTGFVHLLNTTSL